MKTKKLQFITVLIFILTILFMSIGLILIDLCNYRSHMFNQSTWRFEDVEENGFQLLKITSIYNILSCSANYVCYVSQNNGNFYNWIQLQVGVILCVIFVPILTFIFYSLIFFNVAWKIRLKNNNFWDAIQNCEIINNYYIH